MLCDAKFLNYLKLLVSIDKSNHFKTKIDYGRLGKTRYSNAYLLTALSRACLEKSTKNTCNYLIKNVYCKGSGYDYVITGESEAYKKELETNKNYNSKCKKRFDTP